MIFLLTPLREGRHSGSIEVSIYVPFLLTPLREGRPIAPILQVIGQILFLLTPLREGRP